MSKPCLCSYKYYKYYAATNAKRERSILKIKDSRTRKTDHASNCNLNQLSIHSLNACKIYHTILLKRSFKNSKCRKLSQITLSILKT